MNKSTLLLFLAISLTSGSLLAMEIDPAALAAYAAQRVSKLASARSLSRAELTSLAQKAPRYPGARTFLSKPESAHFKTLDCATKPFKSLVSEKGLDSVDGTPVYESRPASRCYSTPTPPLTRAKRSSPAPEAARPTSAPIASSVGRLTMLTRDLGLDTVDGIASYSIRPIGRHCRSAAN